MIMSGNRDRPIINNYMSTLKDILEILQFVSVMMLIMLLFPPIIILFILMLLSSRPDGSL